MFNVVFAFFNFGENVVKREKRKKKSKYWQEMLEELMKALLEKPCKKGFISGLNLNNRVEDSFSGSTTRNTMFLFSNRG